jgi:hypothetical protein
MWNTRSGKDGVPSLPPDEVFSVDDFAGNVLAARKAASLNITKRIDFSPILNCGVPQIRVKAVPREVGLALIAAGIPNGPAHLFHRARNAAALVAAPTTPEMGKLALEELNQLLTVFGTGATDRDRSRALSAIPDRNLAATIAVSGLTDAALPLLLVWLDLKFDINAEVKFALAAGGPPTREALQERVTAPDFAKQKPLYHHAVLSALAGTGVDAKTAGYLWDKRRNDPGWREYTLPACVDLVLARSNWEPLFEELLQESKKGRVSGQYTTGRSELMARLTRGPSRLEILRWYGTRGWRVLVDLLDSSNDTLTEEAAIELGMVGPAARDVAEPRLREACSRLPDSGGVCLSMRRVVGQEVEHPTPRPFNNYDPIVAVELPPRR